MTDWSFNLRSTTRFFDSDDSDDDVDNVGDAGTSSLLSSSNSQILREIDLAAREDSAQYKPNPWSIARVNAASRPRQSSDTVKPVSENPAANKLPQGAIVDAFKRQAQKPKTATDSSAQANRLQILAQKPVLTSAIDAPGGPVSAPARFPAVVAHITTSAVDPVPISSQPRAPHQYQRTPLPSFSPRKAFPASHPGKPTNRPSNLQFTPNLERVEPFSSPAPPPPRPQHYTPRFPRSRLTPTQAPAHFEPRILETHIPTSGRAHTVTNDITPITLARQEDGCLAHPLHSECYPTLAKPERKIISPHPRQNIQPPAHLKSKSNQPISPESETIPPSSSFTQAHRFFEHGSLPAAEIKQSSPESKPILKESRPSPLPSYPRTVSPPRKYTDPYDQLPPSPDSGWSTLRPPTRKATSINGKGRSKASDIKSEKFRLPLSFGTIAPKEPPQKKARVVTYLPPPPPKKQKTVVGPHSLTQNAETGICMDGGSPSPVMIFIPFLSSISGPDSSDEWITFSATIGRNGSTELTHAFRAIRFEWYVYPLQTCPREDPSGTHTR